jgi:flagellar biosynthesis/type III secretory pathway protein FliH
VLDDKIVIGEFRSDIEGDAETEKKLAGVFRGIEVVTTTEGRKLVPIQELLKIEKQLAAEKEMAARLGYDSGYKKGREDGCREAQKVLDNFATLMNEVVNQRQALYEEARQKILDLVLMIARKVTFKAARIDPGITAAVISGVIDKLVDKSHIKIKVHPDHLPLIEQQINRFNGDSAAIKELTMEPDDRVRYGGCFIETPGGDVDARIDSQIDVIAEAVNNIEDQQ